MSRGCSIHCWLLCSLIMHGCLSPVVAAEPIHSLMRKLRPMHIQPCSIYSVAREITNLEADLRATGTITIKGLDVTASAHFRGIGLAR